MSWTTNASIMATGKHRPIMLNYSHKTCPARFSDISRSLVGGCTWLYGGWEWEEWLRHVALRLNSRLAEPVFEFFLVHKGNITPKQACTCGSVLPDTHHAVEQSRKRWGDAFGLTATTHVLESDDILNICLHFSRSNVMRLLYNNFKTIRAFKKKLITDHFD